MIDEGCEIRDLWNAKSSMEVDGMELDSTVRDIRTLLVTLDFCM